MSEIEQWLADIGMDQYGPLFCAQEIDLAVLPELRDGGDFIPALKAEYSSKDDNISVAELKDLLAGAHSEIDRFLSGN